jgi:hypothetical protein
MNLESNFFVDLKDKLVKLGWSKFNDDIWIKDKFNLKMDWKEAIIHELGLWEIFITQ